MSPTEGRRQLALLITFCAILLTGSAGLFTGRADALERVVIGGEGGVSWQTGGDGIPPVIILAPREVTNDNTPGGVIDFSAREGWMFPESADQTENIALQVVSRGGQVTAPTTFESDIGPELLKMVDDDGNTAFVRKGADGKPARALGLILQLDLGARFGVSRIRFFPRNSAEEYPAPDFPFQDDFIKAFEIFINDGRRETQVAGRPVFTSVLLETQNNNAVADVLIDPQYVRHIQIKSQTTVGFEVAELQVFGEGFVPTADFHSDIFDMGSELSVWGNLRWEEGSAGDPIRSQAIIATRSGRDSTPVIFHRIRSDGEEVPWQDPEDLENGSRAQEIALSLDEPSLDLREAEILYRDLSVEDRDAVTVTQTQWSRLGTAEKGTIHDDLDNWSTWTPPYSELGQVSAAEVADGEGGVRITSPGPRRFFQFKVEYTSEDLFSARGLGSLSFDYTNPALAERIIAEITPRQAELGELTAFSLVVVPELRPGVDRGFNSLTISTPVRVNSIGRLSMGMPDGSSVEDDFINADLSSLPIVGSNFTIVALTDDHFQIEIPAVASSRLGAGEVTAMEFNFECVVLRTGTEFVVEAQLQGADEVAQRAVAGNALILREGGVTAVEDPSSLAVQVEKRGGLLINVHADPRVVTPNDDGLNDTATIRFDVTDLTSGGDVAVRIYDLSGRLVRLVDDNSYASGRYARAWDGKNEHGDLVSPGIYIYTIDVDADAGAAAKSGTIAVAY
jgi:hypothetical protein